MLIILCFCCGFFCALGELAAIAENVPRLASARKKPARTTKSPIKTRRLKKADREADFFFMNDCMWMEFKCEPRFTWIAGIPKRRSRDLSIPAALESYQLLTVSYQPTSRPRRRCGTRPR